MSPRQSGAGHLLALLPSRESREALQSISSAEVLIYRSSSARHDDAKKKPFRKRRKNYADKVIIKTNTHTHTHSRNEENPKAVCQKLILKRHEVGSDSPCRFPSSRGQQVAVKFILGQVDSVTYQYLRISITKSLFVTVRSVYDQIRPK